MDIFLITPPFSRSGQILPLSSAPANDDNCAARLAIPTSPATLLDKVTEGSRNTEVNDKPYVGDVNPDA